MHYHLGEIKGHLFNQEFFSFSGTLLLQGLNSIFVLLKLGISVSSLFLLLSLGAALDGDSEDVLQVHFKEVENSGSVDLVVDGAQNLQFQGLDILNLQLFVGDLFVHGLHLKWVDILILRGYEHTGDTKNVQLVHSDTLHGVSLELEVSVHQVDSQEEGLVIALKVGQHLYHPVDHSGSKGW